MVPKPVKRKPEDELPMPNIAIKKAKASSAVDGYQGDDDELQYSMRRWMDDSLRLSSDKLSEVSKANPVEEAEEVQQGGNNTKDEDPEHLDSEKHFKKQGIAILVESNQTWESKQSSDPKIDIYSLNAAMQLQNDLENLESEMVIRDRIPWESFGRELCRGCKAKVDQHLQATNRRQPEISDNDVETRPSLGTWGSFDYFLGLPTLEELAKKQRDIETLRILRPISQKFPLEDLEPKLCEKCDKSLRTSGKLPAKAGATAPVTSHSEQIVISSGSEGSLVHVTAEQSKQKPNAEKQPVPASGLRSQPPVPIDPPQNVPPKIAPPKQVTAKKALTPQQFAPDEPQPPARAGRPKKKGSAPKLVALKGSQPAVQTERPKGKGPAPKAVAPEEPQPPTQAESLKKKGPAPKAVAPGGSQPPARAERPTRQAPAPRAVAPKEPQLPAPVVPEKPQPPAQAERPKKKGPALKTEPVSPEETQSLESEQTQRPVPELTQLFMPVSEETQSLESEKTQTPVPEQTQFSMPVEELTQRRVPEQTRLSILISDDTQSLESEQTQRPVPVKEETQPPVQAGRPKRQGKTVAPKKTQPPVRNERPKRKGPASKAVASEETQPPAPGGKLKKKDPTPGPIAPKEAEPIQPAASKKPRKKPSRARKTNIPDPPPASLEPATHGVDKVEDRIEEAGPIQRVMGSLPEKPKGHDYYCAICYTNLTRMGSAKKLEHLEKCGTTLEEVKVMTKAQAQVAKAAR